MHFKKLMIMALCLLPLGANAEEEQRLYLKFGTGLNTITPVKLTNDDYKGKLKLANNFPLMEAGVGYRLTDTIRTEIIFDYYFLFHSNETSVDKNNGNIFNIIHKTKINTLMLNGYKDIITVGRFTPFIGGGVGINDLKNKTGGTATDPEAEFLIALEPSSFKKVHQFVYKLTAGTDIKLSDSITGELSYNFFNLGDNRSSVSEGSDSIVKRNYYVHNVTAGIRFNF